MEKKLKISDFAALVGTSQKTVYSRLSNPDNLPLNEQLKSVSEKVRGRETTFIVTTEEQIQLYQTIFNHLPVIEGEYEDNLTFNNPSMIVNKVQEQVKVSSHSATQTLNPEDVIKQIINLNEVHREELNTVNKELIEYKSKVHLLEYHEGREGLQINEINELRKDNKELTKVNYNQRNVIIGLISVIVLLMMFIIGFITFNDKVNELQTPVNDVEETVINGQKPAQAPSPAPVQANKSVQSKKKR